MRMDRLDHLVLTVADIDAALQFYTRVLGMEAVTSAPAAAPRLPHQQDQPAPGLPRVRTEGGAPHPGQRRPLPDRHRPPDEVLADLERHGVPVEEGPVPRTGATGPITSVYIRDPDHNLIELSVYE